MPTTSIPMSAPSSSRRRQWLKLAGGTLAGALGAGSLSSLLLTPAPAWAADYKALVCLFLYGGNDGMNMVVPTDATRHAQYAAVRGALALPRRGLVPLGGTDHGLHPAMSALAGAWADGGLAPVFNVGPLFRPMTQAEYRAAAVSSGSIPDSLFSHSHQQALWETASTSSFTRTGWGGRAAEALATANPVISLEASGRFGLSTLGGPLGLPGPGSHFGLENLSAEDLTWQPVAARKAALDAIYAQPQSNLLLDAVSRQHRDSVATADRLGPLIKRLPAEAGAVAAIDRAFASLTVHGKITAPLAQQLYQIAKLIAGNATVQGNRQIFFASLGGFDTHSAQIGSEATRGQHAALLKQLADATAAFYRAMQALGMGPQVTLFTQSDFGRTFQPNSSSGTDHAWGNHQLVLGGAVRGSATYGVHPVLVPGGPDDVDDETDECLGRWIPTTSVNQYAATLLRWFGATDAQLDTVLPQLVNFGSRRVLGFL
ncbi:MAG TPA: DUF1501 domain-containing protein [Rubrivivax sp.]|nr:DUF1501 domain-containing protein [Rubrivivax sp.]